MLFFNVLSGRDGADMSQNVSFSKAKTVIGACGVALPGNAERDDLPGRELHKLLHFHGECHE